MKERKMTMDAPWCKMIYWSKMMTRSKVAFIIAILFSTLVTFYVITSFLTKETLIFNDDYKSEFCRNFMPESTSRLLYPFWYSNTSQFIVNFAHPTRNSSQLHPWKTNERRKIFLMETSGKSYLNARQACAVESAARQNKDTQIIVYFISSNLDLNNEEILALVDIPNVSFQYLNLNEYFNCSPLHSWYIKGDWIRSSYRISHMSDALRFLTLWKFGGMYLDLDVVVIKPMDGLRNFAGKESEIVVAPGVMAFDRGHDFLIECLKEFSNTYSGSDWGWNGPQLITRVLKRVCGGIANLDEVSRDKCGGVTVLPSTAFYALQWKEWKDFFSATKMGKVMKRIKNSYLIHVWNKHSSDTPVKIGSGQPIMANKKIAFSIVIVFAIVGMFYTLIPIVSKEPTDFYYHSEFCTNHSPDSATVSFDTLFFQNLSHPTIFTLHNLSSNTNTSTVASMESATKVPKKIFLMETSGKDFLNARQACAVESAAIQNPDMQVIIYFTSPSLNVNMPELLTLAEIPNISFQYLNLEKYFNCSPLFTWFRKDDWKKSPYKISHMSDALRFLTLWKFGGIYLDLDVVVIKSLAELRNCAGKESKIIVAPGVMAFDQGHKFLNDCLVEFSNTYSGSAWGWNGPYLITRVLKRVCGDIKSLDTVTRERCIGVTVLPSTAFYAVKWQEWKDFFNVSKTKETMKKLEDSYLIHVWNKHSSKTPVKIGSGQVYEIIAKRHCPSIYALQKKSF
uniref:Alpha 1,4-glycosyltransferase domain-containing protein n=1 Tax=Strigamia maritima TaxID=126957 RepID=T1JBS3_STRMM